MKNPNQSTAKIFLNTTTYKPLKNNSDVGLPHPKAIDITDILRENGVCIGLYEINGVSMCELEKEGEYGDVPVETHFVISQSEISDIAYNIFRIIDAAIVNTKQADAIKSLIKECTDKLEAKCWDRIRD